MTGCQILTNMKTKDLLAYMRFVISRSPEAVCVSGGPGNEFGIYYRRNDDLPFVSASSELDAWRMAAVRHGWGDSEFTKTQAPLDEQVGDAAKPEAVNHPDHYNASGIECIDAIEAALTPEEFRGFIKGNVLKYVWREKHKAGDQDLAKATWYLNRLKK